MDKQVEMLVEIDNKVKELSSFFVGRCVNYFSCISSFYKYAERLEEKHGFEIKYENRGIGFERKSFRYKSLYIGVGAHYSRPLFLERDGEKIFIGEVSGYDSTPKTLKGFSYEKVRNVFVEIADTIMNDYELMVEIENEYLEKKKERTQKKLNSALEALNDF